ncbi:DUF2235 domain-containing protein [Crocosphaera sp.]|uniref:T6SS phospholipase effector Tle1-like catalytic domain-containing protein n=1 Tax=Crocosphaera sp. TaxID=2729996 RepID=UPI0026090137|nr:DUF2235 domain-containing protein [Crocosphaera sp.]MDJ0578994.1 DUF2235 domain-containing protein [Crocosphaera sp.]
MTNQNGKNIVICLDGTGIQFRENNSNIVRLYSLLEKDSESQLAYYDPGVGTLGDPNFKTPIGKNITRFLGLAFGRGIIQNIEEAYSYLMEHYNNGDHIFIFGFSRGAYTARALAGFVHSFGLLDSGCQNLIPYAMKLYRSEPNDQKKKDLMKRFKQTYSRECRIHFLGLWDCVKSFGWIYNPIFLPHTTDNESVDIVRHAISIDERRNFFQPMLSGNRQSSSQDIKQVWFAGVHGDVGGGFDENESGLAKIALEWMIEEALTCQHDLRINEDQYRIFRENINKDIPTAKLHNSLIGTWWLIQYLPRIIWDLNDEEEKKVLKFPQKCRTVPSGSTLHSSVWEKLIAGNYQPKSLELSSYDPNLIEKAISERNYSFEPPLSTDD